MAMDEATFRSGKQPDGTPIAHGQPLTERNLRVAIAALRANNEILRAGIAEIKRIHDWRVTGLLEANNVLLERARAAERKLRENGLGR
jgi:hypothetical protein